MASIFYMKKNEKAILNLLIARIIEYMSTQWGADKCLNCYGLW